MKRWRQKGQYQYSAMLSVAAGSLGSICILFLTGAARAAHAHPCLSSAAPFHGAFRSKNPVCSTVVELSAKLKQAPKVGNKYTLLPTSGGQNETGTTATNIPYSRKNQLKITSIFSGQPFGMI